MPRGYKGRRVFSSHWDCVNAWVQQSQDAGTTGKGHVFFERETVFSYGHHFPMARFVMDARGARQVLVNESRYSRSTSKHQGYVRQALHKHLPWLRPIYVSTEVISNWNGHFGVSSPDMAIEYMAGEARKMLGHWGKARTNKPHYEELVMMIVSRANRVAELWGLAHRYPDEFESARLALTLELEVPA